MSPKKRSGEVSLLVFMASRLGLRRAAMLGAFIGQWGVTASRLGREPTRLEYCDEWGYHQASYYRHLDLLKAIWPDDKSPQRVWLWCEAQLSDRKLGTADDIGAAVLGLGMSA